MNSPNPIQIGIVEFPESIKSAIYGLSEMLEIADNLCLELDVDCRFSTAILSCHQLPEKRFSAILIPPFRAGCSFEHIDSRIINWLQQQHKQGAILTSACAGAFILAATGIIGNRSVTTHWRLNTFFEKQFPNIQLDTNALLIHHGDIITAGGMMSWVDLGLELVLQFSNSEVMRQLGKALVVDTAPREQQYYQQFRPSYSHGDQTIITVQQSIQQDFMNSLTITALAENANLTPRTIQRRFVKATGLTPKEYIQRVRIQKVCDLLETTNDSFEYIANQVGYDDVGTCRRAFCKIMGLQPSQFRARFFRDPKHLRYKPAIT
ncbi:GlxA family transcriptional regulator [Teredinibacter sp. KSP-S5-2]|uniref:GlxA family transcriptional regulator n=1 Tax=Teredinibacter sp. KSP-S5-2 TaxID=3034506 RepID=UPI00293464C8|nr:helix-turn-helix domain-containing protein [Teredinibacter sp. KSP-S5-2]WNO09942.1 helix-turn-helix domain-containing protein [Teredinibacter sp. KSP-S5-2]